MRYRGCLWVECGGVGEVERRRQKGNGEFKEEQEEGGEEEDVKVGVFAKGVAKGTGDGSGGGGGGRGGVRRCDGGEGGAVTVETGESVKGIGEKCETGGTGFGGWGGGIGKGALAGFLAWLRRGRVVVFAYWGALGRHLWGRVVIWSG